MEPTLPRWLGWVLAVLLLGFAFVVHADRANARPSGWVQMCNTEKPYSPDDIRHMIRCATERWGGDASKIINMGSCESGLDEDETGNLPFRSVFQYHPDTWYDAASRLWHKEWGNRHVAVPNIMNGRAQVLVTVKFVTTSGYGPWDDGDCA